MNDETSFYNMLCSLLCAKQPVSKDNKVKILLYKCIKLSRLLMPETKC